MMTATICPSKERLRTLTLGCLPDQESEELFEHLRTCDTCRSELETIENAEDSLIVSLRAADDDREFDAEPDCRVAMAKALGALALASDGSWESAELPQTIGEYQVVRPLGRGGMGNVYLARHTKLGREVALKVLASHRLADVRMRERFENEMRAIGRLSHPNVVTAHDAREVDGTAVLVTEFIDGLDLGQLLLRTGPLAANDAAEIARQVALALEYTSQQGFVHRDVKPSNIMLSSSGEVKLLDLGLARWQFADSEVAVQSELTATGQAMGTADYVAPEQVTDSRQVDARADVYALGCTLFKLLSGSAPFADEQHATVFAKMTAHVSTPPPSLQDVMPGLPKSLVQLVAQMLSKTPDERPQTPLAVAERLRSACAGSDLEKLALHARQLEPRPFSPRASTASLKTAPLLRRSVSMPIAIGAAFASLLVGLCLGVIITIKLPDGTTTQISVPDGSEISLAAEGGQLLGNTSSNEFKWIPFTGNKFEHFLDGDQAIVLQITAAWSMQSQVNQEEALDRPAVQRFIKEKHIVPMIADWTEESTEIAGLLKGLGKKSLPLTVVVSEDKSIAPIVLQGLITERQLMEALVTATTPKATALNSASPVEDALHDFDANSYRIKAGDSLIVRVDRVLPETVTLLVLQDGTLSLPLLDPLKVQGLTLGEISALVSNAYVAAQVLPPGAALPATIQLATPAIGTEGESPNTSNNPTTPAQRTDDPLSFAILASGYTAEEYEAATKRLRAPENSNLSQPVQTEIGTWYVCDETISSVAIGVRTGRKHVLVSNQLDDQVSWPELFGHLSAQTGGPGPFGGETKLQLRFDPQLAKRMRDLSAQNIGQYLAIMIAGKVVAAPRINSEITDRAEITGNMSVDEIRYLHQCINGGLVTPLKRGAAKAASSEDPFGGKSNPFSDESNDPFGGSGNPFGGADPSANPFGDGVQATEAEPRNPQTSTAAAAFQAQTGLMTADDKFIPELLWEVVHYLANPNDDGQQLSQTFQNLVRSGGLQGSVENVTNALSKLGRPASIKAVTGGLPAEAAWLTGPNLTARTLRLDTEQVLADVRKFVTGYSGSAGLVDEVLAGLAKDPNGPRIDVQRDLLDHLGEEAYLVLPPPISRLLPPPQISRLSQDAMLEVLLVLKVDNVAALEKTMKRLEENEGHSPPWKLAGEYLIVAKQRVIDAAVERRRLKDEATRDQ